MISRTISCLGFRRKFFQKVFGLLFSLFLLFSFSFHMAYAAVSVQSGNTCTIETSIRLSPDYSIISANDTDGRGDVALTGTFNANEKCVAPFTVSTNLGIGWNAANLNSKIVPGRTGSVSENVSVEGHFKKRDASVTVSDSCGFVNSTSASVCSIERGTGVDNSSIDRANHETTCIY